MLLSLWQKVLTFLKGLSSCLDEQASFASLTAPPTLRLNLYWSPFPVFFNRCGSIVISLRWESGVSAWDCLRSVKELSSIDFIEASRLLLFLVIYNLTVLTTSASSMIGKRSVKKDELKIIKGQTRCRPRVTISRARNLLYSPTWLPIMHFDRTSSSRSCSSAAEIFPTNSYTIKRQKFHIWWVNGLIAPAGF